MKDSEYIRLFSLTGEEKFKQVKKIKNQSKICKVTGIGCVASPLAIIPATAIAINTINDPFLSNAILFWAIVAGITLPVLGCAPILLSCFKKDLANRLEAEKEY